MFHVCYSYDRRRWVVIPSIQIPTLAIRTKQSYSQAETLARLFNEDDTAHKLALAELTARLADSPAKAA